MRIIIYTLFLFCYINLNAQNQTIQSPTFNVEELQADFKEWRKRVEKKHPLLYLYHSKTEIDATFDKAYQAIQKPMAELQFFCLLASISHKINDGHNFVNPSSQTIQSIIDNKYLIPIEIQLINDKLFIIKNLSTSSESILESEILSINDVPSSKIIEQVLSILPSDGNTPYSKSIFNTYFRFYYHICFGVNSSYLIEYKSTDNIKKIEVKGSTLKEIRSRNKEPNIEKCIQLEILDSLQTAILTLSTFDAATIKDQCQLKFKKVVQQHFNTIQNSKTEHLILDLRNNDGGNPDFVKYVLKHLMNQPFQQNEMCRVVKKPNEEDFFERTTKRWYPAYGLGKFKPVKNPYKGKIYVLINNGTFSAGVDLAYVLKKYERAVFIGQETGGNPIIMGGFLIKTTWELSNTKLQVSPATLCTLSNDLELNTGRGILPDYVIESSSNDYKDVDKYIVLALELIQNTIE